ncbi:MAG: hypothetical protein IJS53_04650 [Clostridia bacterium]|nr:hypothetical protein [Clostridia bacterium]
MANNKADFKASLRRLLAAAVHNWPWKLLALFLAVCIWSWLITQDESLTREKVFTDVAISVQNADTLRRSGYIVVSGLDDLPAVRIRVAVPQKNYDAVTAAYYNLRVDLSRIRGAGEQTLAVLSTSSSSYGAIIEQSVESITVQVEEYITRSRIPVRLNVTGGLPEGYYAGEARVDPSYVVVSGPRSLVEKVVRCVADYDLSSLLPASGTERTAVPFRLVDADGNDIDLTLIDVTSESVSLDSITVEQTLYTAKTLVVNTADLVTGSPAEGYSVKRISSEPATLLVAGSDQAMAALTEVHLVEFIDQPIDITGQSGTVTRRLSLSKPNGLTYLSSDTVIVTVEITPQ